MNMHIVKTAPVRLICTEFFFLILIGFRRKIFSATIIATENEHHLILDDDKRKLPMIIYLNRVAKCSECNRFTGIA